MLDYSVIIVTHNRAGLLPLTLAALSRLSYPGRWEALVVDNGSTDATREVVVRAAADFPVPLRYLYETQPGKYWALNAGIQAAQGACLAATDDDAYPAPDWLERAAEGFARFDCAFVGGAVLPVWQRTPPRWLDARGTLAGKVLALQNHGPAPREYGRNGVSWPLGVNVAYRREAFERVGLFDGRLGRLAGTLRNQSQREWHLRALAAGLRGMYLPGMVVHHSVDAARLTRRYFHRWFYWHGVSRAILYQTRGLHLLEPESGVGHEAERRLLAVPASVWRTGARACASAGKRWLLARSDEALEYELQACFCAGVIRQRWRDRRASVPLPADAPGAGPAGRGAESRP